MRFFDNLTQIASKIALGLFVAALIGFPIWIGVAWWSIKLRLNVGRDMEPQIGVFLLTVVSPYAIGLCLLFALWRILCRMNGRNVADDK